MPTFAPSSQSQVTVTVPVPTPSKPTPKAPTQPAQPPNPNTYQPKQPVEEEAPPQQFSIVIPHSGLGLAKAAAVGPRVTYRQVGQPIRYASKQPVASFDDNERNKMRMIMMGSPGPHHIGVVTVTNPDLKKFHPNPITHPVASRATGRMLRPKIHKLVIATGITQADYQKEVVKQMLKEGKIDRGHHELVQKLLDDPKLTGVQIVGLPGGDGGLLARHGVSHSYTPGGHWGRAVQDTKGNPTGIRVHANPADAQAAAENYGGITHWRPLVTRYLQEHSDGPVRDVTKALEKFKKVSEDSEDNNQGLANPVRFVNPKLQNFMAVNREGKAVPMLPHINRADLAKVRPYIMKAVEFLNGLKRKQPAEPPAGTLPNPDAKPIPPSKGTAMPRLPKTPAMPAAEQHSTESAGLPLPVAPTLSKEELDKVLARLRPKAQVPAPLNPKQTAPSTPPAKPQGYPYVPVSPAQQVMHTPQPLPTNTHELLRGTRLSAHLNRLREEIPMLGNVVEQALRGPEAGTQWSQANRLSPFRTIGNRLGQLVKNAVASKSSPEVVNRLRQWRDAYRWDNIDTGLHTDSVVNNSLQTMHRGKNKDTIAAQFIAQHIPTVRSEKDEKGNTHYYVRKNFVEQMSPKQRQVWDYLRNQAMNAGMGGRGMNDRTANELVIRSLFRNAIRDQNMMKGWPSSGYIDQTPRYDIKPGAKPTSRQNVERFKRTETTLPITEEPEQYRKIAPRIHRSLVGRLRSKFRGRTRFAATEQDEQPVKNSAGIPQYTPIPPASATVPQVVTSLAPKGPMHAPKGGIVVREGKRGAPGQFYHGGLFYNGGEVIPKVGV